jgi:hypothetical protein
VSVTRKSDWAIGPDFAHNDGEESNSLARLTEQQSIALLRRDAEMTDIVTISKSSFIKLVDLIFNPNPDDDGDPNNPLGSYGPGSPVIRDLIAAGLLNPGVMRLRPPPQPWRSVLDARETIDRAFAQYQLAEMLGGSEQSEKIISATRSQIQEFVDDYCGNGRPKWPRPRRLDAVELQPIDLVVAGVQFQKMADLALDNPLREDLAAAADKLIEVGLKGLEQ